MKRVLSLVLALTCILVVTGCSQENIQEEKDNQVSFVGTVIEVNEEQLLVEVTDKADSAFITGNQVYVKKEVVSADGCPDVKVGEYIRVFFDGSILDSIPAKIGTIFSIYKTDETGNNIE